MNKLPFELPKLLHGTSAQTIFAAISPLDAEDILFETLVDFCKTKIPAAKTVIIADCAMPVRHQRALAIACRESGNSSFIACVAVDGEGITPDGWESAAALVMLQNIGACAMLFTAQDLDAENALPEILQELYEDTSIPLGLVVSASNFQTLANSCPDIRLFYTADFFEGYTASALPAPREIQIHEREEFIAVSNGCAHLLNSTLDVDAEIFEFTNFIQDLLDLENDGCTILRTEVGDEDELEIFEREEYMIKAALCVTAPNEFLFEKTLRAFCGRAMYDGTIPMDKEFLAKMTQKYGLIVL